MAALRLLVPELPVVQKCHRLKLPLPKKHRPKRQRKKHPQKHLLTHRRKKHRPLRPLLLKLQPLKPQQNNSSR